MEHEEYKAQDLANKMIDIYNTYSFDIKPTDDNIDIQNEQPSGQILIIKVNELNEDTNVKLSLSLYTKEKFGNEYFYTMSVVSLYEDFHEYSFEYNSHPTLPKYLRPREKLYDCSYVDFAGLNMMNYKDVLQCMYRFYNTTMETQAPVLK